MPRPGSHVFNTHAVQRAMDAKAARWGAPAGYYSAMERIRKLSETEQVWAIRTRLYAGAVSHTERVVFIRADHDPYGPICYAAPARTYQGPSAWKLTPREEANYFSRANGQYGKAKK